MILEAFGKIRKIVFSVVDFDNFTEVVVQKLINKKKHLTQGYHFYSLLLHDFI